MATTENSGRIAFGLFEVDLQSGEIWKSGYRVRLQGLPFKVLCALLAKPGQVVSRGELQMLVWGPDTNVDFERALAVAINKVREALADSAENPRFVETLAKRGYRFIAPVSVAAAIASGPPAVEAASVSTAAMGRAGQRPGFAEQEPACFPAAAGPNGEQGTPAEKLLDRVGRAGARARIPSRRETALACAVVVLLVVSAALWQRGFPAALPPLRIDQLTHTSPISAGTPGMESLLTLVADGDRIITSVSLGEKLHLAAIGIGTGEVQPLIMPGELDSATIADISSDGSHLLLRSHLSSESEQPLWIVPATGGSALRVGNILAQDATWMPDGISILFANGDNLSLVRPDGGTVMPYAKLPGRAFFLRWSPDGKLLRFTLMDPSTHSSSIWQMDGADKIAHPLFQSASDHAFECCGTWTGDGKEYVFERSDTAGSNLWEVRGNGAILTQLTNGPLRYSSPVAARSGHRIFFYGSDQPSGLQQYDGKQMGFQPAPVFLADANRVDYSRNGKWVAWTDTAARLWRARAEDGSEKIQLTPNSMEVFLAHWSPDASRLAMMAREPGQAWQIYLVSADGGRPERLQEESGASRNAADPGWSADGQRLVYGREPDAMGKEGGPHTIEIFDLRTRTTTTLPQSEGLFSPRWSPDGKWITALTLDQTRLMLFNLAEARWKELPSTSAADPVWSSDSKAIYVHAFMAEQQPILRVSVPEGEVQTVASIADFHSGEPANYFFGGLTPANEPLIRPRVGTGNLYRLDLDR